MRSIGRRHDSPKRGDCQQHRAGHWLRCWRAAWTAHRAGLERGRSQMGPGLGHGVPSPCSRLGVLLYRAPSPSRRGAAASGRGCVKTRISRVMGLSGQGASCDGSEIRRTRFEMLLKPLDDDRVMWNLVPIKLIQVRLLDVEFCIRHSSQRELRPQVQRRREAYLQGQSRRGSRRDLHLSRRSAPIRSLPYDPFRETPRSAATGGCGSQATGRRTGGPIQRS